MSVRSGGSGWSGGLNGASLWMGGGGAAAVGCRVRRGGRRRWEVWRCWRRGFGIGFEKAFAVAVALGRVVVVGMVGVRSWVVCRRPWALLGVVVARAVELVRVPFAVALAGFADMGVVRRACRNVCDCRVVAHMACRNLRGCWVAWLVRGRRRAVRMLPCCDVGCWQNKK